MSIFKNSSIDSLFSWKIQLSLKKLLNSKIFGTYSICDKKGYINFWDKMASCPKKWLKCTPKKFFTGFLENTAAFEKNYSVIQYPVLNS